MPNNEYYEYYGPDYQLDVPSSNMSDHNTPEYLDKLRETVFEVLREHIGAPSVQMQGQSKQCVGKLPADTLQKYQRWRMTTRMRTNSRTWRAKTSGDQVRTR